VDSASTHNKTGWTSFHSIDVGPGTVGGSGQVLVSGNHIAIRTHSYADGSNVSDLAEALGKGLFFFQVDQNSTFVMTSTETETFSGNGVNQSADTVVIDQTTGINVAEIYVSNADGTSSVTGKLIAGRNYDFYRISSSFNFGSNFGANYSDGTGTSTLDVSVSNSVPEPSSAMLFGLGGFVAAIGALKRRGISVRN